MPQRAEESIARTGEQSQRAAEPVEPLRGIVGHQIRQRGSRSSSSRDGRPDLSVTSADLGVYEPAGRVGPQALASRRHSTKGQWRRPPRPRKRREPRRATSPQRSGTRDAGPPSNLRSKGPDVAGRAHHAWHLTDVLRDQLQVALPRGSGVVARRRDSGMGRCGLRQRHARTFPLGSRPNDDHLRWVGRPGPPHCLAARRRATK
jgi:hypothetical protein